ncbi:two-component sensor histidine kinase [Sphingomonas spermidinifaciens]|uniref:histidine kinase n=1 Tax=Sphingomonas spermidinifaciens TaxID=1141889 RepID=A0A2A4B7V5_9SPHN|nr:HAMP domain-containing sensor histidine kinase [Sphingomonas spermidinifaciens]PCD04042.1 two-component sensor histidine kinase [Sphingomonas spermidinifaciens]
MKARQPSLKRPLIIQPLILQFVTVFLCCAIIIGLAIRMDSGGPYADERITKVIAGAIARGPGGGLTVTATPELATLRAEAPDLWFVAQDDAGRSVAFGDVPAQYRSVAARLTDFAHAAIRDPTPPYRLAAVIRRETSPAGPLTILGHGRVSKLTFVVFMASNVVVIPIFLLMASISLIVTPWIVRRSLAGVARVAAEAERIDTNQRSLRLNEQHVPREIGPLVRAVNDALARLDEGYARQQRFIASAAHELRTPIAILRAKVEAADDPATRRLASDVARLGNVAEQLLDLQRLDGGSLDERFDLAGLARHAVADLAPLLIASSRTIQLIVEGEPTVRGDAGAIERVIVNLVQNAIDHGGRNAIVRVTPDGFEVEDDGPGIPPDERERVFEPFHRLRPRSTGTGLGLHLVQQVVERHRGKVAILGAPDGGTLVRVELPPA